MKTKRFEKVINSLDYKNTKSFEKGLLKVLEDLKRQAAPFLDGGWQVVENTKITPPTEMNFVVHFVIGDGRKTRLRTRKKKKSS